MNKRRDDESKRRRIARLRFQNLVRCVCCNRIWLLDAEEQKMSLNVKKNIAMVVRPHRKIGILTMEEKALIRTPHSLRTVGERKRLVTLLSGLMCFTALPPKIRARLVPVIHFMLLGPGRQLVRENTLPQMVYFILYGEVEVSKQVQTPMQNLSIHKFVGVLGPGECVGEIELIENYPSRRLTYTTTTTTELLVVFEKDFEHILLPVMSEQWMQKKTAIKALDYFNYFSEEQLSSACKFGILRQFEPLDTIFHEDKGLLSYVHFVTSGECMILQCLKVKVKQKGGMPTYDLVDITKDDTDNIFQDLTNKELMQMFREETQKPTITAVPEENHMDSIVSREENLNEDMRKQMFGNRKNDVGTILKACGITKEEPKLPEPEPLEVETMTEHEPLGILEPTVSEECEECPSLHHTDSDNSLNALIENESQQQFIIPALDILRSPTNATTKPSLSPTQGNISVTSVHSQDSAKNAMSPSPFNPSRSVGSIYSTKSVRITPMTDSESGSDVTVSGSASEESDDYLLPIGTTKSSESQDIATKIENHFIDVGSMTFGGVFGLGEKFQHRVIMARTTVQCLMLPRFWLLEKEQNPGNIWQRRRFYLNCTIPSRRALYQDFLETLKWQHFKQTLIKKTLDPKGQLNHPTKIQDVPIICRIMEGTD